MTKQHNNTAETRISPPGGLGRVVRRVWTAAAVLALGSLLGSASAAVLRADKVDMALEALNLLGIGNQKVIVQFTAPVTDAGAKHIVKPGVALGKRLSANTFTAVVSSGALANLSLDPKVGHISLDAPVRANLDTTDHSILEPSTPWQGSLPDTLGLSGAGTAVAVIDSGVAPVPGIAQIKASLTFLFGFPLRVPASDGFGHGTHVAGIVGGNLTGEAELSGIAPKTQLLSLQVLDGNGAGTTSDVISALNWCVANKDRFGIDVINMSLSHPPFESYTTDPLCQAAEAAWKAGITVVCSAGNWGRNGYATIGVPGNDPYVITVGAMNAKKSYDRADDVPDTYSSKGPTMGDGVVKPDILAPGNRVVSWAAPGSTLATEPDASISTPSGTNRKFLELSGTSMAAPVVAGAAALMVQQARLAGQDITPDQIKARLMVTAEKRGYSPLEQGAGYLDINAALASTDTATDYAVSPLVVLADDGSVDLVDPLTGEPVVWEDRVLWGDSRAAVWGDSRAAVWGDSRAAVWGDAALWGDRVIWGDSATAADCALWGNMAIWGDAFLVGDGQGLACSLTGE